MPDNRRLLELAESDPEAALALLAKLDKRTLKPHDGGQREIIEDHHRFKIVCCGRRFGKSTAGAKIALMKCREPNQMVWWVAPTYKIVKRGYMEVLRQLPENLITHIPSQDSAFDAGRSVALKFKNGSRLEFYSAERPEGMLGQGVDLVVLDEAAIMAKNVWEQTVRPTLMDRAGQAMMISTPRGRNWFYYLWLRGQNDVHPNYKSWRFPTSANPFIPAEEIEEMRASMPLVVFQQEVLAEFISSAGAVFRFDHNVVTERVPPVGHIMVGVDLAKTNDFTVLSAAREDLKPCGYERFNEVAWAMQRNRIKSFVRKLLKAGATGVTLVMDSTGVGDPIVEEIEADGYDVIPINFTKTKQHMVVQLGKDLEDGYVRLDKEEDISEYENYSYKVTEGGRWTYSAPEGQHDDCVSAKMLQHWGLMQEGIPSVVGLESNAPTTGGPEQLEAPQPPEDDWSDLIDQANATDVVEAFNVDFTPDSTASISGRSGAWNARES